LRTVGANPCQMYPYPTDWKEFDPDGLLAAVEICDEVRVKTLIQANLSDLNKKNEEGFTALHRAVLRNSFNPVKWLVKAKAKIDLADEYGWTALDFAVGLDRRDIGEFLAKKGASTRYQEYPD